MRVRIAHMLALLLVLGSVGTAWADDPVVQKFPAKGVKSVRVSALSGSVTVIAKSSRAEIEVVVEGGDFAVEPPPVPPSPPEPPMAPEKRTAPNERPESDEDEWDAFFDRGVNEQRSGVRSARDGSELSLRVRDGNVKIYAPKGIDVSAKSRSGELLLSGSFGQVDVKGWSGSISFAGSASRVDAKTMSGGIELDANASVQKLTSISGDVRIRGAGDDLTVASTSGDVEIAYMPDRLHAKTVSGELRVKGALSKTAVHELEAVSGDILIWITRNSGFTVGASSFDADVWINGERYHGNVKRSIGDGSATIRVATMNGEVRIKEER